MLKHNKLPTFSSGLNSPTTILDINGAIFEEKRLELDLSREELGKQVCSSANQIKQIEVGGLASFYSFSHKLNTAKKVALYLKIPETSAFTYKQDATPAPQEVFLNETQNTEPNQKNTPTSRVRGKPGTTLLISTLFLVSFATFWLLFAGDGIFIINKNIDAEPVAEASKVEAAAEPQSQELPIVETDICDAPKSTSTTEYQVKYPQYKGDSLSVRAAKDTTICVLSGASAKQKYKLQKNVRLIIPVPPQFILLAENLADLRLYFQGEKVDINPNLGNAVAIKENPAY